MATPSAWMVRDGDFVLDERTYMAKEINVFLAKVMAIREALSWIRDQGDDSREHVIWMDSLTLSAVTKLHSYMADGAVISNTMLILKELNERFSIKISWIKGHANHMGNEYADALECKGAHSARELLSVPPYLPITFREIKKKLHSGFVSLWQNT